MVSSRVSNFTSSACLAAKLIVQERRAEGLPVFDFGLGETKGELLPEIVEAGTSAFQQGRTGYGDPAGLLELREAVLSWLALPKEYSTDNVVITVGAKQSIFNTFASICDPGDTVLVECAPWVSYLPIAAALSLHGCPVEPPSGGLMKVTPEMLTQQFEQHPNTRLLLVNSPCNPTGQFYTQAELEGILEVCLRENVYFVLDQLYWKILFDGRTFPKLLEDPAVRDSVVLIDGLSKNFRGTGGLRIGWTVAPRDLAKAMIQLQSHVTSGATTPAQWAALAAISQSYDYEMVEDLERKRDLFCELTSEIPSVSSLSTEGAYYSFWNVSELFGRTTPSGTVLLNSDDVTSYLINEAGVITVSGRAFQRDGYLRCMFHIDDESIRGGLGAVKVAVEQLS